MITHTRFFESPGLPYTAGVDMVIALGGPMRVNDEHELSWLVADRVDGPHIQSADAIRLAQQSGPSLYAALRPPRVDQRPSVAYVDQHVSPAGSNAASSVPETLPAGAMPARAILRTERPEG